MTRSRLTHVLRTSGAVLLPAVVLLCCAGRSNATCGNYVQIIGPDGTLQLPTGHDPMPAERPCQGPECTGGPKAPAPVPPAPTSPLSEVKGLVGDTDDPDTSTTGYWPGSDAAGSPVRRPTSVFHPPRAS